MIWKFFLFFSNNKANLFQPLLVASAHEIRKTHDEHILAVIDYFLPECTADIGFLRLAVCRFFFFG